MSVFGGKNFSNRDVYNILILPDLLNSLNHVCAIFSGELDVDHACFAALEHDVLELLHVPLVLRED